MSKIKTKVITGIYCIKNLTTQRIYIGSADDIFHRWSDHLSKLKAGKHKTTALQNAWNKFGENDFKWDILEETAFEDLYEKEKYWMKFYGKDVMYNFKNIVLTTKIKKTEKQSKDLKEKLSKANSGENNPNSKITEDIARKIKQELAKGFSNQKVADMFNVSAGNVSKIKNGTRWASVAI